MTKKEIVKQIADQVKETQLKTKEIVRLTFEAIIETLVTEGRIELRNFGVFEVKQRKPRKARNPRTGARVDVEAKNVVTFQPGKEMEEKVRKEGKPVFSKRKPRKTAAPEAAAPSAPPATPPAAPPAPAVPSTNGSKPHVGMPEDVAPTQASS